MKKIFLILFVLAGFCACEKYENFPVRPLSFEIDGKTYYSVKDTQVETTILGSYENPVVMDIDQYGDTLDIHYYRRTDFINYGIEELSLNLKGVIGQFKEGERISFTVSEIPETYYQLSSVPYILMNPIKTSSASDLDKYVATEGWIEFTAINPSSETLSGKFEFKAVLVDDEACSHKTEIEVKNGTFKNIPFSFNDTSNTPPVQIQ